MNKFFITLVLVCLVNIAHAGWFTGWFGNTVIEPSDLQIRNGIFYAVNTETPLTGKVIKHYEDGKKQIEINYKNGKVEGLRTKWYDNGKKQGEANYEDNRREGLTTLWYKNGQKSHQGGFKNGRRDGLFVKWLENGEKQSKESYKNGKLLYQ